MEHQRSCPAVGDEPTPGCQRPSQNHPGYEICQDCRINVDGERVNTVGTIRNAELDDTCNGEPCLVYHAIPRGIHTFHVRAVVGYGPVQYTRWSPGRNYDVQEPGRVSGSEFVTFKEEL